MSETLRALREVQERMALVLMIAALRAAERRLREGER